MLSIGCSVGLDKYTVTCIHRYTVIEYFVILKFLCVFSLSLPSHPWAFLLSPQKPNLKPVSEHIFSL